MKLENQVCTLEQAQKLKALGVWQSAMLNYSQRNGNYHHHIYAGLPLDFDDIAAFSVAELGSMLGHGHPSWLVIEPGENIAAAIATRIGPNDSEIDTQFTPDQRYAVYMYDAFDRFAPTEAQARAMLLISSIECEVPGFTIKEVNSRLLNS